MKSMEVAAAVLPHPEDSKMILIGQRRSNDTSSLKWEFPGGKLRSGETYEEAIVREIEEELNWKVKVRRKLHRVEFRYSQDLLVKIEFILCQIEDFKEPEVRVHEEVRWVSLEELGEFDFLEANRPFVKALVEGAIGIEPNSPN